MRWEEPGFNILRRLHARQAAGCPPGSTVPHNRRMFEVVVPDTQVRLTGAPDCHLCKFLPSGELVGFGSMQHEVLLFRCCGLSYAGEAPPESLPFDSAFQLKFRRTIALGEEMLCKELCLATPNGRFLLLASCTAAVAPPQPDASAVQGVPFVPCTTFHLVCAESGTVCSRYCIADDFVHLSHANGVFLWQDMLAILAVRSQSVHLLHIREGGRLVLSQQLGCHTRDTDELALARYADAEAAWQLAHPPRAEAAASAPASQTPAAAAAAAGGEAPSEAGEAAAAGSSGAAAQRQQPSGRGAAMGRAVSAPLLLREPLWSALLQPSAAQRARRAAVAGAAARVGAILPQGGEPASARPSGRPPGRGGIIEGVRQRLMAYLFLQACRQGPEAKKRFFYHFEEYANLAMWKVQMLDSAHLLISMGLPDAGLTRESGALAAQSFCLVVWSLPAARVVDLHDAASPALARLYQRHWQAFHCGCALTPWHRHLAASAGCRARLGPGTPPAAVRRVLANLPASCQALTPSPYLDASLYSYDEKLISALVRPRPRPDAPLKFAPRRTGRTRFRLPPPPLEAAAAAAAPQQAGQAGRQPRAVLAHHFHPWLPLVLCVSQSFVAPPALTLHVRA